MADVLLKSDSHCTTLECVLESYLNNEKLADVTLVAEGKSIQVHSIVLLALSKYFQKLSMELLSVEHTDKHVIIDEREISFANLKAIVHYMYKGQVQVSEQQLSSFMDSVDQLKIQGIRVGGKNSCLDVGKDYQRNIADASSDVQSFPAVNLPEFPDALCEATGTVLKLPPPLPKKKIVDTAGPSGILIPGRSNAEPPPRRFNAKAVSSMANSKVRENNVEKRNGRFVCQKCGRDYKRKQTLQRHLKYECGVAPQFHCPMCSHSSKQRSQLNRHVQNVHDSGSNGSGVNESAGERFTCEKCGRDYKYKHTLENHLKYECGVAPQFHCPMCSYSSKLRSNLSRHVRNIHNSASTSKDNSSGIDEQMNEAFTSEDDSDSNCSNDTHVSDFEEEEKEYVVDRILDRRLVVHDSIPTPECYEYLVAWEDCSEEENTWEPYEYVKNCKAELKELNQRLHMAQKASSLTIKIES